MIVDCAHYLDGSRQSDRTISLDEAAVQCHQGGFVWLGLFEPSGEELDEVRYAFDLHELAEVDRDGRLVVLPSCRLRRTSSWWRGIMPAW